MFQFNLTVQDNESIVIQSYTNFHWASSLTEHQEIISLNGEAYEEGYEEAYEEGYGEGYEEGYKSMQVPTVRYYTTDYKM